MSFRNFLSYKLPTFYEQKNTLMNKILLFLIAIIGFHLTSWSQEDPDYSVITFKNKLFKYKKKKPNLTDQDIKKEHIKDIVTILGAPYYPEEKLQEITDQVWLSFTDPKKFDFVFKDIGVRTTPNWSKKNARGKIVLEPNPFVKIWTEANGEPPYFQKAITRILSYHKLMAYAEDAKATKKWLGILLYSKKYRLKTVGKTDWTNSYLKYANNGLKNDGLTVIIAEGEYDFVICHIDKKEQLISLFKNLNWNFVAP